MTTLDFKVQINAPREKVWQQTELNAQLQATEEFKDYLEKTFPKALEMVKKISEE